MRRGDVGEADSRVGPRQSNGAHAGSRKRRHQPGVHRSRQHPDHHREGGIVGDAKAVDLPLLDAGRIQRRVDFLAAAMNDDERPLCGDVRDDVDNARQQRARFEQLTAELDDDRSARSQQAGRLGQPEHHVHVLNRLP